MTVIHSRQKEWFIFKDVPVWVYSNCGHRYLDIDVLAVVEARMQATPGDARPIAISLS